MRTLAVALIRLYQVCISPLMPPACRFIPTCSEYAKQAVLAHGFFRGTWLATTRICKCHPWHSGGYDPVPKQGEDVDESV